MMATSGAMMASPISMCQRQEEQPQKQPGILLFLGEWRWLQPLSFPPPSLLFARAVTAETNCAMSLLTSLQLPKVSSPYAGCLQGVRRVPAEGHDGVEACRRGAQPPGVLAVLESR